MKSYMYILTNAYRSTYLVGTCNDVGKMLKFYNDLPTISIDPKYKVLKMVYCEEFTQQSSATQRFEEITAMNKQEKEKIIEFANPEYVDLIPGINIEI